MNYNIIICTDMKNDSKRKFRKTLIKLYPQHKKYITENINVRVKCNEVRITNDGLNIYTGNDYCKCESNDNFLLIAWKYYIKIIELLSKCDNNTIVVKPNSVNDNEYIIEQYKQNGYIVENSCYFYKTYLRHIIINKKIYAINEYIHRKIFNNIKVVDVASFIRMMKIKKLL